MFGLFVVFNSCSTAQKQEQKFKKYAYNTENKAVVAEVANNLFPCIETEQKTEVITNIKTEYIKGDSIPCPKTNINDTSEKTKYVQCPDNEKTTETKEVSKEVKVKDTREIEILNSKVKELNKDISNLKIENETLKNDLSETEKLAKKRNIWNIILFAVIIGFIGYKCFRLYVKTIKN